MKPMTPVSISDAMTNVSEGEREPERDEGEKKNDSAQCLN